MGRALHPSAGHKRAASLPHKINKTASSNAAAEVTLHGKPTSHEQQLTAPVLAAEAALKVAAWKAEALAAAAAAAAWKAEAWAAAA
eukprot:CAMPEP_0119352594 /NCGR_PEP_ID=MMETSP1334-20130426/1862_1 /TAXON_ID=127549 /ORGANISM="Calcidiscus leptoporus, Strain RCC1130" /LENGTH=85 /DNA_ID=CAMNT_0007365683 /DNA_START=40 /DNA_END=295 /DNA_ORIENTATION=-